MPDHPGHVLSGQGTEVANAAPGSASPKSHGRHWLALLIPLLLLLYACAPILITQERMYRHDTLKHLPFFSYFIDGFQGALPPAWSPFTHSGEPFYLYAPINGLLKPTTLLAAAVHRGFPSIPMLLLHEWEIFASLLLFLVGAHLFFTCLTKRPLFLLIANLSLALCSISLCLWAQVIGCLDVVIFLPWILYFLHAVAVERRPGMLIPAGIAGGAAACCYIPVYLVVYLAILGLALLGEAWLFRWPVRHLVSKKMGLLLPLAISCFVLTALPAISLVLENSDLVPIARMSSGDAYQQGVAVSSGNDAGGTPATSHDLQVALWPTQIQESHRNSDIPVYVGSTALALAIVGLCLANRPGKRAFAVTTLVIYGLSLGPILGLSTVFQEWFPGFRFIRHMEMFQPFLIFNLVVLAVMGMEALSQHARAIQRWIKQHLMDVVPILAVVLILLSWFKCWLLIPIGAGWILMRYGEAYRKWILVLVLGVIGYEGYWVYGFALANYTSPMQPVLLGYHPPAFRYQPVRDQLTVPLAIPAEQAAILYHDPCRSIGEPLLFYRDSAFFADNLRYTMLKRYFDFTGGVYNADQVTPELSQRLGIGRAKLAWLESGSTAGIQLLHFKPNEVAFQVQADRNGDVLYRDVYHRFWQATIDGQPVSVEIHDGLFKKIPVAAGRHLVVLRYRPILFLIGFYALVAAYCAGVLWAFVSLVRRLRGGHARSGSSTHAVRV